MLSFALLALATYTVVLPLAICCLFGAGPVRRGGRAAAAICACTAVVPACTLAGALVMARISAGGWLDAWPQVATMLP